MTITMNTITNPIRDFLCLILLPHKRKQRLYDEAFANGQATPPSGTPTITRVSPVPVASSPVSTRDANAPQSRQNDQEVASSIAGISFTNARRREARRRTQTEIDGEIARLIWEIHTAGDGEDITQMQTKHEMGAVSPLVVENCPWLDNTPVTAGTSKLPTRRSVYNLLTDREEDLMEQTQRVPALSRLIHSRERRGA